MNKRFFRLTFLLIVASLILFACTNRNLVTKEVDEDETAESLGEEYGFTMFNVTFDTTEMKEALIGNYDEKVDKTEAVYESKIDNVYLHGDKAMEKLDKIFKELELDAEMDDEDMIKETAKAFEVMDYKSLKLKVTFKGRDTKELMMTK
ncbi:YusW family protein [Sporosarcina pasteurii]|uniref:YusW-like protein n=1 Tax=Sporosarcina pasteurii TaxID=1474 RepID=A0A380BJW2_SPOPA|nr:YusW family protein [Sporosarcina pasteurii]MDS9470735.1 YusW family protein [Sporosarcina pasteurii]SUJ01761.1 Uncharacterised protein [Sporosarcina pasteurii]